MTSEGAETKAALEHALEVERAAVERFRAVDAMKNTFLHAVSHELRGPLSTIEAIARLLELDLSGEETRMTPQERAEAAARLSATARKTNWLLTNLLDLDRLVLGILEPNRKETDLSVLVRQTIEESELSTDRPLGVEVQDVTALVDPILFERILENLISNVGRHTPPGTAVLVRLCWKGESVLLEVEDQGPGIPAEKREEIFDAFGPALAAGASGQSPGAVGLGIGLSLVRRFAEIHGGRAWVEEGSRGGATFKVLLPAKPVRSSGSDTESAPVRERL